MYRRVNLRGWQHHRAGRVLRRLVPDAGARVCVPVVTACLPGFSIQAGICTQCDVGLVCAGGSAVPAACAAGNAPNKDRSVCVTARTFCARGFTLVGGECVTCPFGYACDYGAAPILCDASPRWAQGVQLITAPIWGYVGAGDRVPESNPGACNLITNPLTQDTYCMGGMYPSWRGCYPCPNDMSCISPSYRGEAPRYCGAGEILDGLTQCYTPTQPTVCAAGTFRAGPSHAPCYPCPDGLACDGGGAAPTVCGAGLTPNVGQTGCTTAVATCPPGAFLFRGNCLACPPGQACPGGTAASSSCTSPQVANAAASACVAPVTSCAPGTFLQASTCFDCRP